MSKLVELAILGAGDRGHEYTLFANAFPERVKIVAVADPDEGRRNRIGEEQQIPAERRFSSWQEFISRPKMCDAVAICTQDQMHEAPAVACASLGYHILLEKPMAPTADACRRITAAIKKAGVIAAVCHVMRYSKYTRALQKILHSGVIGDIVSVQHLEPVGYFHYAHSFVRGNWRNEGKSSFMLLSKSCHDIDWLRAIIGHKCLQVQSFGNLHHFKAKERPAGAADRCCDCPMTVESACPYSAVKIYFRDRLALGNDKWPINVFVPNPTPDTLSEALKKGPYGRCVFACDNDVVDNQVVNFLFEGGITASMTMTAFTIFGGRRTTIFGTLGEISTADSRFITVRRFLDDSEQIYDSETEPGATGGHGGGDFGVMESFINAVASNDKSLIVTGLDETLESHLMVFAAEESRHTNTIVSIY